MLLSESLFTLPPNEVPPVVSSPRAINSIKHKFQRCNSHFASSVVVVVPWVRFLCCSNPLLNDSSAIFADWSHFGQGDLWYLLGAAISCLSLAPPPQYPTLSSDCYFKNGWEWFLPAAWHVVEHHRLRQAQLPCLMSCQLRPVCLLPWTWQMLCADGRKLLFVFCPIIRKLPGFLKVVMA